MSIKESALNTITALTNSDFVRMVTSAGASRKATLQNIAQHVIESYTGSSLAGKNQSVKAALDGLNSTLGASDRGTAEYVENAQTANSNGITYQIKGKTLFVFLNQARVAGAATADFTTIASIPYALNAPANAFYALYARSGQAYELTFRASSGKTNIFLFTSATTGFNMRAVIALPIA